MHAVNVCRQIDQAMARANISRHAARAIPEGRWSPFRISPEPYYLTAEAANQLVAIGPWLRDFYHAADRLYRLSVRQEAPAYISRLLDRNKPQWLVQMARQESFRDQIPVIIRPDLLFTAKGLRATELDSVPGSMGLLSFLTETYSELGFHLVGEQPTDQAFLRALSSTPGEGGLTVIVISEECSPYRPETDWLAGRWQEANDQAPLVVRPEDLQYDHRGVWLNGQAVSRVYRFFELFDWENVPGVSDLLSLAAAGKVTITPPPKHYLEEKTWFAFFHHPELRPYWQALLPEQTLAGLEQLFPPTWLVTPDLAAAGQIPLGAWEGLKSCSRRERPFVLKPSGFSPLAWGGHGFSRGKDYTTGQWSDTLTRLLGGSDEQSYILQSYEHSLPQTVSFCDTPSGQIEQFAGKTRLCPYYFLEQPSASKLEPERVIFAGALATTVPVDKPVIHGMTEAVMSPAALGPH